MEDYKFSVQKDVIARPIGKHDYHHQEEFGNDTELQYQFACQDSENVPDISSYFAGNIYDTLLGNYIYLFTFEYNFELIGSGFHKNLLLIFILHIV